MALSQRRQLSTILGLVLTFAAVEWLVGSLSHSLALQSDAGHMLTDAAAIVCALIASWCARLTLIRRWSGHSRLEVGIALFNGIGLLIMASLIAWESVQHLTHPVQSVLSTPMLWTAVIGLVINGVGVWILHRDSQHNLNLHGAFLHVLADLASSVGVIVGAIAIAAFHYIWLDGVISLVIACLITFSAIPLIRRSWKTLTSPLDPLAQQGFMEVGRTDISQFLNS